MSRTDVDPVIPDELADALRRAAAAVPPAELHPTGPMLRLRARRRRHRLVVAAGSVAAALTAVVAVNLASDGTDSPPLVTGDLDDGQPTTGTPDQHGIDTPLRQPGGKELLPDGTEHQIPKAQPDDIVWSSIRLADGRLVTLAARPDEDQGPPAPDVGAAAGLVVGDDGPTFLAVFDANGVLLGERDIHRPNTSVELIGDYDGQAVVSYEPVDLPQTRGAEVVAIDPDTFEQTRLVSDGGPEPTASAAAGRLVVAHEEDLGLPGKTRCWADVFDLPDGEPRRIDLPGCLVISEIRLSPAGRHLAMFTDRAGGGGAGGQTVLQVLDLETGEVVAGAPLPNPCRRVAGGCSATMAHAVTWTGDDTAVAVVDLAVSLDAGQKLTDRHILTATVP